MKTSRIEDVTEFVLDGTHGSPERTESGIPVLSAQNVKNGRLIFETERFTSQAEYEKFQSRLPLSKGDVLLTIVGTIGRTAVVEDVQPLVFQRSVAILRPKRDCLDSRFLFHIIQTREFQAQLTKSANKSSQAGVYLGKLKELLVSIPSLTEQRRIADILDRAEALRAKRRAALAQLDELTQSIFVDMFGNPVTNSKEWKTKPLRELVNEFRYGTSNKSQTEGRITLRIPNIVGGIIDYSNLKLVPVDTAEFERLKLIDGDVLFVRTNGNPDFVGRCAVFDSNSTERAGYDGDEFIFASYLIRARPRIDQVIPIFLREFMLGTGGRRELRSRCKTSAGQFNINTENLGAIAIPIPPLPLQQKFTHRVEAVEKLKATHRASLAELDELFASLQYRAFRGEL